MRFLGSWFAVLALGACASLALVGCGGSSGGGGGSAGNVSRFAGTFTGSFYTNTGGTGPISLTIDQTGDISGTATDETISNTQTIAGTVGGTGASSITLTDNSGTESGTGSFSFNSSDELVGQFTSNGHTTTVVVSTSSHSLQYAGTYTGTFSSQGGGSGTVSVTISPSGTLTGTATVTSGQNQGSATLSGTVGSNGAVSITITENGNNDTNTGWAAFNGSTSHMLVYLVDPSNNNSTSEITLTQSGA